MFGTIVRRVAVVAGLVLLATPAHAAMEFGTTEELHPLLDVAVTGPNGEALALGYKTSTQSFLLPYALSDDGYVLVEREAQDTYYPLGPDELKRWQSSGALPNPLPPYEIPLLERIMGHLLWPTLVVIALVYLVPWLRKRRRRIDAPPAAQV